MKKEIISGMKCTVSNWGDLYFARDSRPFINADCVVIKICKSGLIQVALESNPKLTYSVPKRNIIFVKND
jgi:hypothetical protein